MLDHAPILNTIYISGSGFPVMYHGEAHQAQDCSQIQAVYSLLTESFDSERRTLFYCSPVDFKERFNPISEYDAERKVVKRRVCLLVLGSRFNTFGMLSPCEHNVKLLREYAERDALPVRITTPTRDADFPDYYQAQDCQEAWLENPCVRSYDNGKYYVLSADLVSEQLDNDYVKGFFPINDQGQFVVPQRYITSIQIESEADHHTDGRVLLKRLHNAFALV